VYGSKTDSNPIRRIRILPKANPGGAIPLKKALCPPDIAELKPGQVAHITVCLEFASSSNREGDLVGKFDIKTSTGGGTPVEIKPSIGDLLRRQEPPSESEFDVSFHRMQGFQRVATPFQSSNLDAVPGRLLKRAALTPVGPSAWQDNQLRLIGRLPASTDLVLVRLECNRSNGSGTLTVCCTDAMAVNSVMSVLKHSIS
jgi:hypothetical protein